MPRTLFPEFRDEQQDSNYPFGDHCTLLSGDNLILDPGLFLDAVFYPSGVYENLAITSISTSYSEITIYIGNSAVSDLLAVTYDPLSPPALLTLLQGARVAGCLVPDLTLLATLQSWPAGSHSFLADTAEFVPTVTIPCPDAGVTGFELDNGDVISGDVWLVGVDGVIFTQTDDNTLRLDIVGDPLFRRRALGSSAASLGVNYGKTINGVGPDSYGDFKLAIGTRYHATPALRLVPDGDNGLRFQVVGSLVASRTTTVSNAGVQ